MINDSSYLLQALELAKQQLGFCAPNPAVGAVLVKNNQVIGTGAHHGPGTVHAEVAAFQGCQQDPMGATLYVTLEPCCHTGRTPPCTDAIIQHKIARVVFGHRDINLPSGHSGAAVLQRAAIPCDYMPLPEITKLYKAYDYWHKTGLPWLTAKLALSADDKIAGPGGQPVQITGAVLSEFTHQKRRESDAILTTVKTIIHDNPKLNVRLNHETIKKPLFILDTDLRLPLNSNIFKTAASITVFHQPNASEDSKQQLIQSGVNCIAVDYQEGLALREIKQQLGQCGLQTVWLESGSMSMLNFIRAHLVNELWLYHAKKRLGQSAYPSCITPSVLTPYMRLVAKKSLDANNAYSHYLPLTEAHL